jgi:protein ImuA
MPTRAVNPRSAQVARPLESPVRTGSATARGRQSIARRLADLAEQVRRISSHGAYSLPPCPSGLVALDVALGGGFSRAAIHELLAPCEGAVARSVALLTAARAAEDGRWICYIDTTLDFYPPGAAQLGLPLERLLVMRTSRSADALWACEQSLRCRSVAAVVMPLPHLDSYVSRRLQLAAEAGRNLGLLICQPTGRQHRATETEPGACHSRSQATFAASRLRFDPIPGERLSGRGWQVELKAGRSCRRVSVAILKLRRAAPGQAVVLELPDGPWLSGDLGLGAEPAARPEAPAGRPASSVAI